MDQLSDSQDDGGDISEEEIVERVFDAVIEQRLAPGTKLSEAAMCEAFGVGRMRVRRSLLLLASREVVDLHANRGAFIASPDAEQARQVFEARRAVEPALARLAAQRATPTDIGMLSGHIHAEAGARMTGRRHDAIRLSGQFHLLLAQVSGNPILSRLLKELVTRTSLIIAIFGTAGGDTCRDDEHEQIVKALEVGEGEVAAELMRAHLNHIEAHLDLSQRSAPSTDIVSLLGRQRG